MAASPQLDVQAIADLKALARSKPNDLSITVSTTDSSSHLTSELFKSSAGVSSVNRVCHSATLALANLTTGRIDLIVDNPIALGQSTLRQLAIEQS